MADNNVVTLIGTLGADPEMRRTPTGKDVVSFSLVTNERIRGDDGRWTDGTASWFKVTAWGDLGVHAGLSFRKGQRVIARGTLKVETWQARDGGTGKTVGLTAHALGHDLLWGTSTFARGAASAQQQRPQQQQALPQRPADEGWGATPDDRANEDADEPGLPAPALVSAGGAQPSWSTMLRDEDETPF